MCGINVNHERFLMSKSVLKKRITVSRQGRLYMFNCSVHDRPFMFTGPGCPWGLWVPSALCIAIEAFKTWFNNEDIKFVNKMSRVAGSLLIAPLQPVTSLGRLEGFWD